MHNAKIVSEIESAFEQKIMAKIDGLSSAIIYSELNSFFAQQRLAALQEVIFLISFLIFLIGIRMNLFGFS